MRKMDQHGETRGIFDSPRLATQEWMTASFVNWPGASSFRGRVDNFAWLAEYKVDFHQGDEES